MYNNEEGYVEVQEELIQKLTERKMMKMERVILGKPSLKKA